MQAYPQASPATALDAAFASLHLGPSSASESPSPTTAHADPHPPSAHRTQARTSAAVSVTPWMRTLFRTAQDRVRPPIDLCVRPHPLLLPPSPSRRTAPPSPLAAQHHLPLSLYRTAFPSRRAAPR